MRRAAAVLSACLFAAACGSSNPVAPTATAKTPTLTAVSLSAALGTIKDQGQTFQITATGTTSTGATQNVTTTCTNWQSDNHDVLTIDGGGLATAQGSGSSTITAACQGANARGLATLSLRPAQLFSQSGHGDTVFDLPTYVTRVRIQADYGLNSSNFVVTIAGSLIVNELMGTFWHQTHFDGTYLTNGGTVQITDSSGVAWSFVEVR